MAGLVEKRKKNWSSYLPTVILLGFGAWMVHTGTAERAIAHAPRVTPSTLQEHAGTGVPVLLEARAVAVPPLVTPAGDELALQRLTLSHEESDRDGSEVVTDYDVLLPGELWASEENAAIRVVTAGADARFIPEIASDRTGSGGEFPAAVAARLGAGFRDLPTTANLDLSLRAIANGAPVLVYGLVALEDGTPVVGAPGGGRPFVITSLDVESLLEQAGSSGTFLLVAGWICIVLAVALAAWVWRRGRGPAPAAA